MLQFDTLRRLQKGHVVGAVALRKLQLVDEVSREFNQIQDAANHSPEIYAGFAAPGGSANEPSVN